MPKDAQNDSRSSRSKTESANNGHNPNQEQQSEAYYSQVDQAPSNQQTPPPPPQQPVSWTASEYVERNKNLSWFLVAGLGVFAVSIVIYLITRDVMSSISIGVMGIAVAGFAGRPPKTIQYSVDNTGVNVGQKHYPYEQFSSFSVMQEAAVRSILLMPSKRLGLPLVLHYDPREEDMISNILGSHLPHEEREVPAFDRLMTKIHF